MSKSQVLASTHSTGSSPPSSQASPPPSSPPPPPKGTQSSQGSVPPTSVSTPPSAPPVLFSATPPNSTTAVKASGNGSSPPSSSTSPPPPPPGGNAPSPPPANPPSTGSPPPPSSAPSTSTSPPPSPPPSTPPPVATSAPPSPTPAATPPPVISPAPASPPVSPPPASTPPPPIPPPANSPSPSSPASPPGQPAANNAPPPATPSTSPAPSPKAPSPKHASPPPVGTAPAPAPALNSVPPPGGAPPPAPPPALPSSAPPPGTTPPTGSPPLVAPSLAPSGVVAPPVQTVGLLTPPTSTSSNVTGVTHAAPVVNRLIVYEIAAGGGVGLLLLLAILIWCLRRRCRKDLDGVYSKGSGATVPLTGAQYKTGDVPDAWGMHSGCSDGKIPTPPSGSVNSGNSRSFFTYDELAAATNGYSKDNLLGEGGFGRVYKGTLPNGTVVAVKQLTVGGGQGEREFRAEVEVISRVHHRHLVSLVGYCVADCQMLLVYDFVPNGTLEYRLHGNDVPIMDWTTRLKIGLGCARGLAYLHEDCHPRIIHRDIKSSNILLDENWEAQVADFGLAKLSSDTHTHVSTRVMGTFGYLAPEYAASGKLTDRSDVYSFGVVLLELVTGRKPIDTRQPIGDESLVEWARPIMARVLEDGHLEDIVDPNLEGNFNDDEMFRMIETAGACVRHLALKRPRMAQVVRALESDSDKAGLYQGMKPGQSREYDSQYGGSGIGGTNRFGGNSAEFDTQQYNSEIRKFRKPIIETQQSGLSQMRSEEFAPQSSEDNYVHTASSGEYDRDTFGDLPGESRIDVRDSNPFAPRSGQFIPNSGLLEVGNNIGNISGFMGQPPPRPSNYMSGSFNREYVPIGKTVQFSDHIDERT